MPKRRFLINAVVLVAAAVTLVAADAVQVPWFNASSDNAAPTPTTSTQQGSEVLGATAEASADRPNILMLVADDQAHATFSRALMPTVFREIADKGVLFDRHYVASAVCCPSRAEMLTGLFEHNSGVDDNDVKLARPTITEGLRRAGYRTAIAGKYLNSHKCGTRRAEYDLWVCQGNDGSSYSLVNPRLNVNGTWVNKTGAAPEILADYLKNFIASTPATQPFFAMYTPTSPHTPADDPRYATLPVTPPRPASFNEDTTAANKPAFMRIPPFDAALTEAVDRDYVRMSRSVRALDDSVKTILDSLGDRADNTLVVYVSDNGYLFGEHRGHFKEVAYEESVKTPMAIRFPQAMSPSKVGTTSHALVQNVDFAPTFAEQAGIAWRVDGKSLMPLLTGSKTTIRDAALIEHCAGPTYPCGVPRVEYTGVGFFLPPSYWGVVEKDRKYVSYATGERELYDLAADPSELVNLAGQPAWAAEQARLDAELNALKTPPPPDTTISYSSTGAAGSKQTTRTVAFSYFASVDRATFVCRLDRDGAAGSWDPCAAEGFGAGPLADGAYTFNVAAVDRNGVRDASPDTRTFIVRRVGALPRITQPPPSRLRSGTISFTTPAGLHDVQCQLSRSGIATWRACSAAAGYRYENLVDGRWIFRVRGTNVNNVTTSPPSEVWFFVDNAGPAATFSTAPLPSTRTQTADFAFGFAEATSGAVQCGLDGAPPVDCSARTFHVTGLAQGNHSLVVTATDALGNVATTTSTWTVDRTPPQIAVVSPTGTVGPNPLVKFNVNEVASWIFRLDGGVYFDADPAYMLLYSLADGPHKLLARAMDSAGNISTLITVTWTQQTPAPPAAVAAPTTIPTIVINEGPATTSTSPRAAFLFSSDQPQATFICALDGGGYSPCESGVYYEDLTPGPHEFAVRATAGGRTSAPAKWTWTIASG